MRVEKTLHRRVVAACMLLVIVIGGVFAGATYVLIETVEEELIDQRLTRAMAPLMAGYRDGTVALPPMDLRFVSGAQFPESLRTLEPGLHEIEFDGRIQHVLIVAEKGERFALIDDKSDFERIEEVAYTVLAITFLAGLLLAFGIGRALAGRVIAPVTALAAAVSEDRLADHQDLLDAADEIGVLARAFDVRTKELRRVLTRERLFTADVSHELRTPLTAVLGAAELLSARLGHSPALLAVAERIRSNAAGMATRVSALLQLARTPESMAYEVLDLRIVAKGEFDRCHALLEGKQVKLIFDAPEPVWVRVQAELAAIAIDNLVRNACLFTQQGTVTVRLTQAALEVEDTGPGVPEALRPRLFEPFARGTGDIDGGTGLGLSIVKRVAEHLGWEVGLEDRPSGGSRFTIHFGSSAGATT